MKTKYAIGDVVYTAYYNNVETSVICPDCCGKKFLTVILGDDSQVTIPCATCTRGYEDPTGRAIYWRWETRIETRRITGITVNEDGTTEYRSGGYILYEDTVFSTREEAQAYGDKLATEHEQEELAKIHRKEKNFHTWAWHVTYHRQQIKSHEKQLMYHRQKLDHAASMVKDEPPKPPKLRNVKEGAIP